LAIEISYVLIQGSTAGADKEENPRPPVRQNGGEMSQVPAVRRRPERAVDYPWSTPRSVSHTRSRVLQTPKMAARRTAPERQTAASGVERGCSSDGRALQSLCRGQGIDSPQLHQTRDRCNRD